MAAEQRIEGRHGVVSVISDSYGTSIQVGPPEPPEPKRPEVKKLTRRDVMKRFGWTEADYERAQEFDFPAAGKRLHSLGWGWDLIWTDQQIDRWVAEQRAKAEAILRLIG